MRLSFSLIAALAGLSCAASDTPLKPRYVFLFIGDGMGAAQVALAEGWKASLGDSFSSDLMSPSETLGIKSEISGQSRPRSVLRGDSYGFAATSFTRFPVLGSVTTHCAVRRTTESAAAATAMASGHKAGEGAVGLDPHDNHAMRTVAEEARDAGIAVGILTTVSVNHATPAAFYAHVDKRDKYWEIGRQLTESRMPLFAGADFQEPTGKPGENRPDLRELAKAKGFRIVRHRDSLATLNTLPALLFSPAQVAGTALPWAMDPQAPGQPRLADFVATTIRLLEPKGSFFVMAEGGKVDWAGHANDARAAIGEVWDLDAAVQEALLFAKRHPRETLILVTADHETGGLTLGNGERGYETDFSLLSFQKLSQEVLADSLALQLRGALALRADAGRNLSSRDSAALFSVLMGPIGKWTGLGTEPRLKLTREDSLELGRGLSLSLPGRGFASRQEAVLWGSYPPLASAAVRILGRKAGVGWTTHAHTAIPVPIHAYGAGAERFGGRLDNTDIPRILRELTGWAAPKP